MRTGVIGTGSMGKNHLRVVNSLDGMTLSAACDINAANLKEAEDQYGIFCTDDYTTLPAHVDAVMVSTPTSHHYEITKFFIENNKHVLVEKPFTATLDQAYELIELAKKHNVVIGVGHLERFNPAVEKIKDKVKEPLFIETQRLGSFSPRSLDVDVIMDLMIHDLDIILQWDKSGISHIAASGIPIVSKKIDIANVRLEFNSGLVANVTASRVSQKKTRKLRIFQKQNYISLDYKKKRVKAYTIEGMDIKEDLPEIEDIEPLKTLWLNFLKTIKTGKNYNVKAEEATEALKLALDISETIKSKLDN